MKTYRLILLCVILAAAVGFTWQLGQGDNGRFDGCILRNVILRPEADGTCYATLANRVPEIDEYTDLFISFDNEDQNIKRDDSGSYELPDVHYISDNAKKLHGSMTGGFIYPNNRILVDIKEGDWLDNSTDCGSFTIEVWANPNRIREGDVIFRRVGTASGISRGIEAAFYHGYLQWRFINFFYDVPAYQDAGTVTNILNYTTLESGHEVPRWSTNEQDLLSAVTSFTLQTAMKVPVGEWHHYAVTFDRTTGRLSLWVDGYEEDVLFATANRQETGSGATVLIPRFYEHEGSGALIGEDFLGQLENFRISRTTRNTFLTEAYVNSGWIISPVFDSGAAGTPLASFFYDAVIPQQSLMEFQLRTSDDAFTALSMDYPWHTYQNGQQVLLRGRYWQWRARLTMPPDGTASPRLSAVQLDLKADLAPEPPTGLTAAPGNRFVHLTWHFNTENDADGYKVYYSAIDTEPQLYTDAGNKNRITVAPLNNGTTYYFWVTAYDSENPPHESTFSLPVSATPNP